MENKDISQIVIERIKDEGIKPISKKIFNIKRFLFWIFTFISIVVGSFSFAVVLFILINNDWFLFDKFGFGFIFKTLPYFWIIFLVLFALVGGFYYKKTLLGHRKNILLLIGLYSLITISFGSIFYSLGLGNKIESYFYHHLKVYRGFMFDNERYWDLNEKGLISGVIVGFEGDILKIKDRNGFIWSVNKKEAFVGKRVIFSECMFLRIVGEKEENNFKAKIIKPSMDHRGYSQRLREDCLMFH